MAEFDPDVNYRLLVAIMEAWLEGDDEQARSLLSLASDEDIETMLETMEAELRSRGMPIPDGFSAWPRRDA